MPKAEFQDLLPLTLKNFHFGPDSDRMAFGPVSPWARADRGFPVDPGKLCCPCLEGSLSARGFHKVHLDQQIFALPQGSQ